MSPSSPLAATGATCGPDIPPAGDQDPAGHPDGVRATARIRAAHNGRVTTLPQLRSDGPFHLRRLRTHGNAATVGIIGAMSAPLGGDRLTLDITAENRAELEVTTAAATLALRGPTTDAATYDVRLTVGEHASLRWLPQPLISAAGSNLRQTYTVELAATSRLTLREEQLLGRADEEPGHLVTRILVHRAGHPLLDQHTAYGAPEPGWDGPAVLNGHRAIGQLLVVDPRLDVRRDPVLLGEGANDGCAVLAPLAGGPALLATAVAPTTTTLRELLDEAHAHALTR
jgi:urease accessory protein